MSTDKLILKYIDGELTESEDAQLRQILSEDYSSKINFDTDVLVHLTLKEDAESITPPKDLLTRTEDKVLMKILASQPIVGDTILPKRRKYVFAGLVAALFLLTFFRIDDLLLTSNHHDIKSALMSYRETIDNEFSDSQNSNILVDNEFAVLAPKENSLNRRIKKNISSPALMIASSSGSGYTINKNDEKMDVAFVMPITEVNNSVSLQKNSDIQIDTESLENPRTANLAPIISGSNSNAVIIADNKTVTQYEPIIRNSINNTNITNLNNESSVFLSINPGNFYGNSSNVQMTSFFGTDLVNGGFKPNTKTLITQLSQSISYSINEKQRFGIELGYSQYSFDDIRIGRIPTKIEKSEYSTGGDKILVPIPSGNGSDYIEFPYKVVVSKQIFWGAAFFEQSLFDLDRFNLTGRIGAGFTSDGPLGMTRIFGKYQLLDWLSVTAGADCRLFVSKLPLLNNNEAGLRSSLSLIYGFQIKF